MVPVPSPRSISPAAWSNPRAAAPFLFVPSIHESDTPPTLLIYGMANVVRRHGRRNGAKGPAIPLAHEPSGNRLYGRRNRPNNKGHHKHQQLAPVAPRGARRPVAASSSSTPIHRRNGDEIGFRQISPRSAISIGDALKPPICFHVPLMDRVLFRPDRPQRFVPPAAAAASASISM